MPAYSYSSTAGSYILVGDLTASATIVVSNSVSGLPTAVPFKVVLDPGQPGEEIVKVVSVAGNSLTVVRGWDASAAVPHAAGATIRHMITAEDLTLSRAHEDATQAHGASGAVVGTTNAQTLSNKNLSDGTNTFPSALATLTGGQSLTNKNLTSATNTFPSTLVTTTGSQIVSGKTFSPTDVNANSVYAKAIVGQIANVIKAADPNGGTLFAVATTGAVVATGDVSAPNITAIQSSVNSLKADTGVVGNAITAASGWSISVQQVEKVGRMVSVYLGGNRTGATIPSISYGNVENINVATISSAYRPAVPVSGTTVANGAGCFYTLWTDGNIALSAIGPGNDVPKDESFSVAFTYLAAS